MVLRLKEQPYFSLVSGVLYVFSEQPVDDVQGCWNRYAGK